MHRTKLQNRSPGCISIVFARHFENASRERCCYTRATGSEACLGAISDFRAEGLGGGSQHPWPYWHKTHTMWWGLQFRGVCVGVHLFCLGPEAWLTEAHHTGALIQCRSDLDNFSKEFGLRHHSSNTPCFRCAANRSDIPWTAVPPHADWMGHCYTNEEFMAQGHLHKFFGFPGVGMKTFALDVTHMLDLGVLHDFLGSIMHLCVYGRRLCPGEHISVNLSELNNKLSSFYAANPDVSSRLGHLKLDRFTNPSRPFKEFPELRCKAAQARYLVPFGLELARAINNGSEEDEMLCYAASHLHEFYFGMLNGPDFLPRPTSLLMEGQCDICWQSIRIWASMLLGMGSCGSLTSRKPIIFGICPAMRSV
jgi:hypothetical protein